MQQLVKIRASCVGKVMVYPDKKEISKGAKTYMKELWLENKYGYKNEVVSKYLEKGISFEDEAIAMLSDLDDEFYMKNEESKDNKFIKGTCDIDHDGTTLDIKNSWDIKTFMNAELSKLYLYQGHSYMALYGTKSFQLVYCLMDATEEMIEKEQEKLYFRYKSIDESFESNDRLNDHYKRSLDQVRINMSMGQKLDISERVKRFVVNRDEKVIASIYNQVKKANEYYKTIKL